MLTVATWNVLHRVHAENWAEPVAGRWPDEAGRIGAVTAVLAGRGERVVALQEVSGDQLASLRTLPRYDIYALRYPRVPRPRSGESPLADPAEYLVLLVDGPAREVAAEAFPGEPGKGLLAVATGGVLVVATHVTFGPPRAAQLARIAELARGAAGPVVLLGDFNADAATVAAGLGPGFAVARLAPGSPPTRPGSRSPHIDHVVAHGAAVQDPAVIDMDGLSDHNLLKAVVVPR
ncbi:endonuclease/exonuclease/phosphatase family protein [Dactylosporangium sp. CA-233914]|uniref:endonuclease/exonuclease/phosphatase family protein n=1 Tax=Dactylosporangium sp. CA-233914 TaxID=3239934 RepID=UPI003D917827